MNGKKWIALFLAMVMMLSLAACGQKDKAADAQDDQQKQEDAAQDGTQQETSDEDVDGELILDHEADLAYAERFTLTYYKGGYKSFTVADHPDTTFLVVPEGKSVPEKLEEGTVVLQQPLDKITFNSTGMVSLVDAINGLDHIVSVGTDVDGWYLDNVIAYMNDGKIKFSGKYKEPDYEMLTAEGTQLVIDTTMLNSNPEVMEKYKELGIPCFIESSSKESHPLGRVEWVKLFGALMNLDDEANAYFDEQNKMVEEVTSAEKCGKTVAMFYLSSKSDMVYARNGGDYMAAMIGLAGGDYIMADVEPNKPGNTKSTFEDIYARCVDADYLFYVNFALKFDSVEKLVEYNPLFGDFKAVKDGNVYVTAPNFTQSTAAIAGIVEDMHTVLNDPTVETTDSLIKLK